MNPTEETKAVVVQPTNALEAAQRAVVAREPAQTWFRGVPPEDKLNRMYGFAKAICNAAFISPVVRGDEASVFYLVSMAEDLGAQWTHGLRSIYPLVKHGKPGEGDQIRAGIQGDLAMALLLGRKFKVKIKESTDEICVVWMARPDGEMEFEDSFTIVEARSMGLVDKPNWKYKKDMLRWRAIMRVARIVAADILGGMYLREELEDEFGVSERSDSSNGVFQEEGRRQLQETSPFTVTAAPKPEPPTETTTHKPEPPEPVAETIVHKAEPEAHKPEPVQSGAPAEDSKPEPPKEEPATRGRRKAAPKVEGAAAMEALKAEVPPEGAEPKNFGEKLAENIVNSGAFQATTDDLPTNIAAAPHEPASQVDRLKAIEAMIATDHEKTLEVWCKKENIARAGKKQPITPLGYAHHLLTVFIKAFLKTNELPKPPDPEYSRHLPLLESFVKVYGGQLVSNPQEEGTKAGDSWAIFVRKIDGWDIGFKSLVTAVAVRYYPDEVMNAIEFLENDGLTEPDKNMSAFLKLMLISKQSLLAARDAAAKRKVSLAEVVSWLDLDLATEGSVLSHLAGAPVQSGAPVKQEDLWQE